MKKLLFFLLIALLMPISQAQEDTTHFDRILSALETAESYESFQGASTYTAAQNWRVIGAPVGQQWEIQIEQQSTVSPSSARHTLTLSNRAVEFSGVPFFDYVMKAEVRAVNGTVYANAAYTKQNAGAEPLPPDWVIYDEYTDDIWPGIQMLPQELTAPQPSVLSLYLDEIPTSLERVVTSITSQESTLEDGTPVERLSLSINYEGALALGIFFDTNDPISMAFFEISEADPLVYDLLLDENGNLVGLDYTFRLEVTDFDISRAADAPPGTRIDLTHTERASLRLSKINAVTETAAPPPVLDLTALPAFETQAVPEDLPWWNDRVFYEVFVRSFYDSTGDGIGDLQGLIQKLDYLQALGVTGLWLMPVAQSPSYHGYDVVDYFTIEEDYGSNEDFQALMDAAHERGMAVIVDLVMNHTSSEHPWFLASAEGDPAYADFYIWADQPGDYMSPWGSPVWHQRNGKYYYGLFWEGMPDLNYANPAVTDEMHQIIEFWLDDMGVDGFRLDAIRHLIEDGPIQENTPETLQWLDGFHEYVKSINPDALAVGEVWDSTDEVLPYVGSRVDIAFEFDLASAILQSLQLGINDKLILVHNAVLQSYPFGQYATFLTNHDQNRVMSQLQGNVEAAKIAATILLTSPGVPFIYYGEEIGMVGEKPDEWIRTPMQWDSTRIYGGFSTAAPWEKMQNGYRTFNVANQTDDPASLLTHYRTLVNLRNAYPVLQTGAIQLVETGNRGLYSFLRYTEDDVVLVVVNLTDKTVSDYGLTAESSVLTGELIPELLVGQGPITAPQRNESGGITAYQPVPELAPYASLVIKLK